LAGTGILARGFYRGDFGQGILARGFWQLGAFAYRVFRLLGILVTGNFGGGIFGGDFCNRGFWQGDSVGGILAKGFQIMIIPSLGNEIKKKKKITPNRIP
jgi:hypothetical protein